MKTKLQVAFSHIYLLAERARVRISLRLSPGPCVAVPSRRSSLRGFGGVKTFRRRISTLYSYLAQGRNSRRRTRAGGFRWTIDGWTAAPHGDAPPVMTPVEPVEWVSTERGDGRTIFTYEVPRS